MEPEPSAIPLEYRIVVAQIPIDPPVYIVVLHGGTITGDKETFRQARENCQIWEADPATCRIVDRRLRYWSILYRASRHLWHDLPDIPPNWQRLLQEPRI